MGLLDFFFGSETEEEKKEREYRQRSRVDYCDECGLPRSGDDWNPHCTCSGGNSTRTGFGGQGLRRH